MDANKIDKEYKQTGNICVFASYSIIMNYFSDGNLKVYDLIDLYISINRIDCNADDSIETKENLVYGHYHKHCRNNNLRGFYYLEEEHRNNVYGTAGFCISVDKDSNVDVPLSSAKKCELRLKLINGGLAMVLFKNPDVGFHSIVVGYDNKKGYFYRNPTEQKIQYKDFLKDNHIYEFILFQKDS
jgi:hypothetical protein